MRPHGIYKDWGNLLGQKKWGQFRLSPTYLSPTYPSVPYLSMSPTYRPLPIITCRIGCRTRELYLSVTYREPSWRAHKL
jgi:hypothetical protein